MLRVGTRVPHAATCQASQTLVSQGSILTRGYAFSRFLETRQPGVSRASRTAPRKLDQKTTHASNAYGVEEQSSAEESSLWQASQRHPASNPEESIKRLLMGNDLLIITRQLEMMNIFLGFEQTNRYAISNTAGEPLGYIAEEPRGVLSIFSRQIFRTHRPFRAVILDLHGSPILWLRRPFAWINSRMFVQRLKDFQEYTSEGEPVLDTFAEVQQQWHLWRRRYELYMRDTPRRILSVVTEPQPEPDTNSFTQFAKINEGLLAWRFDLRGPQNEELASVSRQFRGFGRELFTDTGQYFVRFGPRPSDESAGESLATYQPTAPRNVLTLEQRALTLAMAVNVDFDYFSRHSEGHGSAFLGFGNFD